MSDFEDETPKHRSKKNTRRWCKGKVGREHIPVWIKNNKYAMIKDAEWLDYVCQDCKKVLDSWFSISWMQTNKSEKPVVGSTEPLKKKE